MNSINNKEQAVKPAYESTTCRVIEVKTWDVLCLSNTNDDLESGGLDPYSGSEL